MNTQEECRYCGRMTDIHNGGYCDSVCEGARLDQLRQVQHEAQTEEQYRASLPTFEQLQEGTADRHIGNERQYLEKRRIARAEAVQERMKAL